MEMYVSLIRTNTEFFVSINDVTEDGRIAYIQRGMLRASFRDVSENQSFYTDDDRMYQPWYPFANPERADPV